MQNLKKMLHLLFVIVGCSGMQIRGITDLRKQQLKCMEDLQILGPIVRNLTAPSGLSLKKLIDPEPLYKCHTPTSPGPCEDGQFIVLDKSQDLFQGYCKPKCSKRDFVRKDGKCIFAFVNKFCRGRIGERLFNNVYGEASECECEDGWSRSTDGVCYQENTYGWCEGGEVLRKITEVEDRQNNLNMAFGNITSRLTDERTIKAFIAQLQSFYREKLVCGKNRCQEEHLWWEDPVVGRSDCFEIAEELLDWQTGGPCVVILNKDPDLYDDDGQLIGLNKIICRPSFDTFTLVPDFAKPCKKGKVWSKHRSKCVRDFSG